MTDDLAGQIRRDLWVVRDHFDLALHPSRKGSIKTPTQNVPGEKMRYAAKSTLEHSPAPVSLDVLDARRDTEIDLRYWVGFLLDEVRGINGDMIRTRVNPSIDGLCEFVSTWADWLVLERPDDAENCAAEVAGHGRKLKGYALPDRKDWLNLGNCPFVIEDAFCRGKVRGYPDSDGTPACTGCGQEGPTEWWEEVLGVATAKTLTHEELIPFIHRQFGQSVKRATLRTWLRRGVLAASGTDESGRTIYSREAVVYALTRKFAA